MKNFIAGIAVLLILIAFPLQTALEMINDTRINKFSEIVYISTQTARTDGYFTEANLNNLKARLLSEFPDLSESDIHISVTETPRYRLDVFDEREAIYYEFRIPVRKILAAPGLFGISDSDNSYISQRKGFVLSEKPLP